MSPKHEVLENKNVEEMADARNLEEKVESADMFEIGTVEKTSDASGESAGEAISKPVRKKRLVAAKGAANSRASSSTGVGTKDDGNEGELGKTVERPFKEEATEKPTTPQRTHEEQQERLQTLKERMVEFERSEKELQEMKSLRKRLDDNETEMKRFREEAARDKKKLREKFEREKYQIAEETRKMVQELTRK